MMLTFRSAFEPKTLNLDILRFWGASKIMTYHSQVCIWPQLQAKKKKKLKSNPFQTLTVQFNITVWIQSHNFNSVFAYVTSYHVIKQVHTTECSVIMRQNIAKQSVTHPTKKHCNSCLYNLNAFFFPLICLLISLCTENFWRFRAWNAGMPSQPRALPWQHLSLSYSKGNVISAKQPGWKLSIGYQET